MSFLVFELDHVITVPFSLDQLLAILILKSIQFQRARLFPITKINLQSISITSKATKPHPVNQSIRTEIES